MASVWQTVRVFISSTFRDMHSERDWLVKRVFPALRERLEKYRVHLIDIDLRWGVTEQQAESGGALDVCLDQIDDCRPFFLGILGERYGFVSQELLERIRSKSKYDSLQHASGRSITELEILYGVLNDPEMYDHSFFCFRDPAFIDDAPPEKQSDLRAEDDDSAKKLKALKTAIDRTPLPTPPLKDYACEYAGLRINWRLAKLELQGNEQDQKALEEVAKDGLVDPDEYARLNSNQRDLVHRFGTVQLAGLEEFGERVKNWLWESIRRQLHLPDEPPTTTAATVDPLEEERDFHERFMESRLRVYVGREKVSQSLTKFADSDHTVACLVTGPSGAGKSAAMSKFATMYYDSHPNVRVIPHFVGASPSSTSLRLMLRRLCLTLQQAFGFAEDVEQDPQRLIGQFKEFLGRIPADHRVLIVLDALNQLDDTDQAHQLHWLPWEFPAHVKVIISCIDDPDDGRLSEPRPSGSGVANPLPDGRGSKLLNVLRKRKLEELRIEALTDTERLQIVREVPSLSAKTLGDRQVLLLLQNSATQNPLFLLVALEELRGFGSFEQLNRRIADFPREGDTVTALFAQVIERLEEEFDAELVRSVLTLLASARRGLSEHELQELVALPDSHRKSKIKNRKSEDLFPVLRQLRPYLLSRAGLIDFYHRNLFKAVRNHYLPSDKQQRQAHVRLAEYFNAQDYWLESLEEQQRRAKSLPPTPRPTNVRKVDELFWQLVQADDWQRTEQLLTDLAFLEAKAEAELVFDLAADFSAAIEGMPVDRPLVRILRLLAEAIRRDIHFIAQHPTTLFQCLWNICWWYDCPEAAQHYQEPEDGWKESPPWERNGPKLCDLLNGWKQGQEARQPGFPWLRSLRPPPMHLGTAQHAVLRGHESAVRCVSFSSDSQRIASGSWDDTVRVWDAASGRQIAFLRGHKDAVNSIAFSMDGRRVVSGSKDRTVRVWDVESGVELLCLRGHDDSDTSVGFSPSGRRVISVSGAPRSDWVAIRQWDSQTGALLSVRRAKVGSVTSMAISPDGQQVAVASHSCVRVWNVQLKQQISLIRGDNGVVNGLAFSSDGHRLVSGSFDCTVRLWDVRSGRELAVLRGHRGSVSAVAFSADGRRIVSATGGGGATDNTVRVWDVKAGSQLAVFRGHAGWVDSVAISPDGRWIASGSSDKTVRLWDAENKVDSTTLLGHEGVVTSVAFSPDGCRIASGAGGTPTGELDGTVRVWDAESGAVLNILRGHLGPVWGVAFFRDGERIASRGIWPDNTVRVWNFKSGECLKIIRESDDVASVAGATGLRPSLAFRALKRGLETVVVESTGCPLSFFPAVFDEVTGAIVMHPHNRTWAGGISNYLCIFKLEGDFPPSEPTATTQSQWYYWLQRLHDGLSWMIHRFS